MGLKYGNEKRVCTPFDVVLAFLVSVLIVLKFVGEYGSDYRMCFLLPPYLASINNLSTAVVKTTDKTMKITYELTEEDS